MPGGGPGGPKGGRPHKSGRQMIDDAAAAIKRRAAMSANPVAVAAGLGPCLLGAGLGKGGKDGRGRPVHHMTGPVGKNGARCKFAPMEYHVAWASANAQAPPAQAGMQYSHLCHNPRCVEPKHGIWETRAANVARNGCVLGSFAACGHAPRCITWPGAAHL